ncbi:MAG: hypothetical protein K2F63_06305 [Muribaculaceae bacterium]|nr:hypothetical protein [Muribaculaceae bacterium]MDE6134050.1 hypothetical protein [Muribaculaceae bacterium]
MKKLVLMAAVVFSMSFFACSNKEQAAEAEAPVVEEVAVEEAEAPACCDSTATDTIVAEVAEVAAAE